MSSQDYSRDPTGGSRRSSTTSDWATTTTKAAKDAMSSASSFAQESVEGVKEAASETAETVKSEVKQLLDRQVKGGAEILGTVARSAKMSFAHSGSSAIAQQRISRATHRKWLVSFAVSPVRWMNMQISCGLSRSINW